jgi:hypothetical protein
MIDSLLVEQLLSSLMPSNWTQHKVALLQGKLPSIQRHQELWALMRMSQERVAWRSMSGDNDLKNNGPPVHE